MKTKNKSSLIKFLQAKHYKKNYSMINLKIEDTQYRFVKCLKIIYKYNSKNKKIYIFNLAPTIAITLKRLLNKTKHVYASDILFLKDNLGFLQSDLLITLTKKIDMISFKKSHQTKILNILLATDTNLKRLNFGTNYKVFKNLSFKKSQHFFFFIFLYSVFKRYK